MEEDIERSDYFIKRHNLRVSEDETNPFSEAHTRRNVLILNHHSSISLASNATTCHLYEEDLLSYALVVDSRDKGNVNNYADVALNLVSHSKNEPKEWKSSLYKQRGAVNDIISKLKCTNCYDWEPPKQLSKLFSRPSNSSGEISSPPRARKNSEKNLSLPEEFPKLVLPKEFHKLVLPKDGRSSLSSISAATSIKPEGQGPKLKTDQSNVRPDFVYAKSTSSPTQVPQAPTFGRSNFNAVKSIDEPSTNFNKNMPSRVVSNQNIADSGGVWNDKPVNPPRDFLSNAKKDFTNNCNNYDKDCYGNGPPGREFDKNGRGGGYGQRGGRDYGQRGGRDYGQRGGRDYAAPGARQSADDQYRNMQENSDAGMSSMAANFFKTARDELVDQNAKKNGGNGRGQGGGYNYDNGSTGATRGGNLQYGAQKRSLGTRRGGGVFSKFVPPVRPEGEELNNRQEKRNEDTGENGEVDERLKNIDPKMIELIKNEIMDISAPVCWDDIAGLEFAKSTIQEIVVWPMMRPDIFTGLRKPPKGLLLFGPPGTGKTLIGKCIASQSQSTFFSISASSLTSKWIGDGEKMVRALFAVAKCHQPAVVFIDEIDSLLTQRSDTEHESSRRIKTEFLVQLDGAATGEEERILVVGATNRPQELDEAARRRLVKRLYIPLPEFEARRQIVERLMSSERNELTSDEINEIARLTEGYSGADMKNVCQEASLGPIRSLSFSDMHQISAEQVRPVNFQDFKTALHRVRASVSQKDLEQYVSWDQTYGMSSGVF